MSEEATLIGTFVNGVKRKHLIEILANPKRRHRATAMLAHFTDFDPSTVVPLGDDERTPAAVEVALRSRGAGESCYVISDNRAIDGKHLPLKVALEKVVGQGKGTLLSCVAGELAYYEGQSAAESCVLASHAI